MSITAQDLTVLRKLVARAEHVGDIRGNSIPLRVRHSLAKAGMIKQAGTLEDDAGNMQVLYEITEKGREVAR